MLLDVLVVEAGYARGAVAHGEVLRGGVVVAAGGDSGRAAAPPVGTPSPPRWARVGDSRSSPHYVAGWISL